jgi:hypothetical protein
MKIQNSGDNVDAWYENESNGNGASEFDVCTSCWASNFERPLSQWIQPNGRSARMQVYNGDPLGTETIDILLDTGEEFMCECCGETKLM